MTEALNSNPITAFPASVVVDANVDISTPVYAATALKQDVSALCNDNKSLPVAKKEDENGGAFTFIIEVEKMHESFGGRNIKWKASGRESDTGIVSTVMENLEDTAATNLNEEIDDDQLMKKILMEDYYKSLPIDWDGAPEFQWRLCKDESDKCLVIFENVLSSDTQNPWFYTTLLHCKKVVKVFPLSAGKIEADFNHLYGRIEAYFQSDHPIAYCAVNNLVHIRTGAHRLKIYLPQTKWVKKYQEILESRLGRIREPIESMRYLIIKPVGNQVTEKEIRETCFKNYPIESVRFEKDFRGVRMAILLFPSTREAVAAHFNNDFVSFGSSTSSENYVKVYFPTVDFHGWDRIIVPTPETDMYCLLTYKEFLATIQTRKSEYERGAGILQNVETNQIESSATEIVSVEKKLLGRNHSVKAKNSKSQSCHHRGQNCCEGIKPAEKNIEVKNSFLKPSGPQRNSIPVVSRRITEDDESGPSRKRKRTGRFGRQTFTHSNNFRSVPMYPAPPVLRFGGGYRKQFWRRPHHSNPLSFIPPVLHSYDHVDVRRRKPRSNGPVVGDLTPPQLYPVSLTGILERRPGMNVHDQLFHQNKAFNNLANNLMQKTADYMRRLETGSYAAQMLSSNAAFLASYNTIRMPVWAAPST
ncbi:unnamed protein product [Thelazia callipaeda]|uniref:RRM domain-containing protein n=1 Tax=Thelazia callipaeda TaxID=103827 RepID=A0A0N5D430_THECL|nr:unnamed protein product [Thelazia callipaeda]